MIEEIKIGQKEILFARHNGKLIYPKYAAPENLVLHYDFSGRTNLDVQKGIAEDLSGNGNNGVLQNFAYIDESGYLDNALIFDGIDDFITIPEPQIDLNNFTYSEGLNVLSFRGDNVATVVGGVVEIGGRNLIKESDPIYAWIGEHNATSTKGAFVYMNSPHYPAMYQIEVRAIDDSIVGAEFGWQWDRTVQGESVVLSKEWEKATAFFEELLPMPIGLRVIGGRGRLELRHIKADKSTVATDWTPAPKDLKTTTFKPLFDKKIKSALYWSRALTDEELLQVYSIQIKRT